MEENIKYYMIKDKDGKEDFIKVIERGIISKRIIREIYSVKKCEMTVSEVELPKTTLDDSKYFKVIEYEEYIRSKIGQTISEAQKTIDILSISIEFMNSYIDMQCIKDKFNKSYANCNISCLIKRNN